MSIDSVIYTGLKYCTTQQLLAILHFIIHLAQDTGISYWALGSLQTRNGILPQFCRCRAGILWRGLRWSLCTGWHSHSPWSYLVWGWALAGCGLHIHAAERAPGPHCKMRGEMVNNWFKHWPKDGKTPIQILIWKTFVSASPEIWESVSFLTTVFTDTWPGHIAVC